MTCRRKSVKSYLPLGLADTKSVGCCRARGVVAVHSSLTILCKGSVFKAKATPLLGLSTNTLLKKHWQRHRVPLKTWIHAPPGSSASTRRRQEHITEQMYSYLTAHEVLSGRVATFCASFPLGSLPEL